LNGPLGGFLLLSDPSLSRPGAFGLSGALRSTVTPMGPGGSGPRNIMFPRMGLPEDRGVRTLGVDSGIGDPLWAFKRRERTRQARSASGRRRLPRSIEGISLKEIK